MGRAHVLAVTGCVLVIGSAGAGTANAQLPTESTTWTVVDMPRVLPRGPSPVPIPQLRPAEPGPVPMPRVESTPPSGRLEARPRPRGGTARDVLPEELDPVADRLLRRR